MKVFISYGDVADQVTALRLQSSWSCERPNGIRAPAYARQGAPKRLDSEASRKRNLSEVVLGVVGTGLTEACRQELNTGLALHKNMIVMSYPEFAPQLQAYFGSNLVVIDPANPDRAGAWQRAIPEGSRCSAVRKGRLVGLGNVGAWLASTSTGRSKLKAMRSRRCTIDSSCIIALDH